MYMDQRKPLVYVSGPYRATTRSGVVQNIQSAYDAAVELWKIGFAVICPHKNTEDMEDILDLPALIGGDLELVHRSDAIFMLPGWQKSLGAQLERDVALKSGKKVFYADKDDVWSSAKAWVVSNHGIDR